ncbi:MAG: rubrerythrin [Planctomycetes bacterium]|nr:rubrerythrin [Planctomycetota bacterium]
MAKPTTDSIIQGLITAYWMEMETVQNYVANATNLDGVLAEEIKKSLMVDIPAELSHAQGLANRVKELGGCVPGSLKFKAGQKELQPPADTTDVLSVVRGVLAAEEAAIGQYNKIIRLCEGVDYVTQELCIQFLAAEESHRREFRGFLAEYQKKRL